MGTAKENQEFADKFAVPGKPKAATEKTQRNTTKRGIGLCRPP